MPVRKTLVVSLAVTSLVLLTSVTANASVRAARATQSSRTLEASGTPIPIGNIGSYSGAEASSEGSGEQAIKAWADWTNAHGGLAGHPVKLYVMDDGNSAPTALDDVKKLVQQDHVVAIVGDVSNNDATWAPYVAQTGVPVIGGNSIDIPFVNNADFYPGGTNVIALSYGMLKAGSVYGNKFGVLYCAEAAQCAQAGTLYKVLAQAAGVNVAFTQSISATAPNYTAPCSVVKDSGVETYQIADTASVLTTVANQCKALGVKARVINILGVGRSMAKIPGLQGFIAADTDAPWFSSAPPMKSYDEALAKYAPALASSSGPTAFYMWVAGQLLVAAVHASKTSTITPASIKQGLYALPKGTTLGGIAPPLTFTQGQPSVINCYFISGIKDDKLVTPDGLQTKCVPSSAVSSLLKALGA